MYKRIKGKKFSRKTDQRKAFLRNLAVNLILRGKITTTKTRARAASSLVERLITKAKRGNVAARRLLAGFLPEAAVKELISVIAPRFSERKGGYTRIIRLGQRMKDGAEMAVVEFVDHDAVKAQESEKEKSAKKDKKKTAKKNDKKKDKKTGEKES